MTYDNTNTGIISKNPRKSTDKHPDITGSLNVEGREYFIDGWQRQKKDGSGIFYSLRVKPKDKQQVAREFADKAQSGKADIWPGPEVDEVPF
jgi:hypothetical protein